MGRRAAAIAALPPPERPRPAMVAVEIQVRASPTCTCGHGALLHNGARCAGSCLLPGCACRAFGERAP